MGGRCFRFPFKYDGVRQPSALPSWWLAPQDVAQVDFDLERLSPRGALRRHFGTAKTWLFRRCLALLQRVWPRCRIANLLILTRHDDVVAALNNHTTFANHYDPEMALLAGGSTFMLGIDDKEHHRRQNEPVMVALSDQRLVDAFVERSERVAQALLENGEGRIDVIKDYFTRVSAEAGAQLLGIEADDADSFADWTLAMSTMIFGDPMGTPVVRELSQHAAWRLRAASDRAIHAAIHAHAGRDQAVPTLVERLVAHRDGDTGACLPPEDIRAILIGTAIGLVPTVTLAAGNVLAWLSAHPDILAEAQQAAIAGNDVQLGKYIAEAARLSPALNPGQFRYVDRAVEVALGSDRLSIPAGTVVIAATAQALRDKRRYANPSRFDPDREASAPSLMFGAGMHTCLGWQLAMKQMTVMFRHLLAQPSLRRVGRLHSVGVFPRRQIYRYGPMGRGRDPGQSMMTVVVPLGARPPAEIGSIEAEVAALGNPAVKEMQDAFEAGGVIHFASLSVLDVGTGDAPDHRLLLELSVDGSPAEAFASLAAAPAAFVRIFQRAGYDETAETFAAYLARHALAVRPRPWGVTGLLYNGSSEFSIRAKSQARELAAFARDAVQFYLRSHPGGDVRPMGVISFIRDIIHGNEHLVQSRLATRPRPPESDDELRDLIGKGREFRGLMYLPSRERLAFVDWRDLELSEKIRRYLRSGGASGVLVRLTTFLALLAGLVWIAVAPAGDAAKPEQAMQAARWVLGAWIGARLIRIYVRRRISWPRLAAPGTLMILAAAVALASVAVWERAALVVTPLAAGAGTLILSLLVGALALLAIMIALAGVAWSWLRRLETDDWSDERDPDMALRRRIVAVENAPGYQQNHIVSCSEFKPGLLRRASFAFAMWGIGMFCRFWTRPGFILSMGTIHFARWLRLPGANKLIFLSNYDGSWESYLEDFITKAHAGQTAAWSHGEGFPPARGLIGEGARDGDRFKRWVRRQQRVTHFWYSRFPDLTLDAIRTNALIHDGLARASTDSSARQWLALFGSTQRPDAMVETHEVQALVFRGLPGRPQGAYLFVRLGDGPDRARATLATLVGASTGSEKAYRGPTVTFGELQSGAVYDGPVLALGMTAGGLRRLGLPPEAEADGLASFPLPFVDGMASRSRILGDKPGGWRWEDRDVDAVLIVLAREPGDDGHARPREWEAVPADADAGVKAAVEQLHTLLAANGGAIVHKVETRPVERLNDGTLERSRFRDHFGFKDGLSQPAMRGTSMARRATSNDLVEPGEFLLGYRSNQGYVAPSLRLRADLDPADLLPDVTSEPGSRFPSFRRAQARLSPMRDFGRNGSFMVVRQLVQKTKEFADATEKAAAEVNTRHPTLAAALQQKIDGDWLRAKIVGRWPDGTLLIDRMNQPRRDWSRSRNDFTFGADDPRGLGCPLGAHIRRAHPRDSLDPDDPRAMVIANRHRLLRRGRHYDYGQEKGLMFAAVCGDIERQFEFIQQRWLGGSSFHGLHGERDPLTVGGAFTIPTVVGPIRVDGLANWVDTVGGGYFFLPSRMALRYLADPTRPSWNDMAPDATDAGMAGVTSEAREPA